MAFQLITTGMLSNDHAMTNCAYVNPADLAELAKNAGVDSEVCSKKGLLCAVGECVLLLRSVDAAQKGKICVSMLQRLAGQLSMDKAHPVAPFIAPSGPFLIGKISFELALVSNSADPLTIDVAELSRLTGDAFSGHVFKLGRSWIRIL